MHRKRLPALTLFCLILISCSLQQSTPTLDISIDSTNTVPPPLPTPEFGQADNPLILALPPDMDSTASINAAKTIAEQINQLTGYTVVVAASDSYAALVDAIDKGNAHIALLDAVSYETAYQKDLVMAAYAVELDGSLMYGSQFIASRKSGFKSYFDPSTQTNTADAAIALAQFNNKKPCWSDETSPSGYLVPFGYLNKSQVITQPAAFVQGHPAIVRSLYAGGICDFGATYVDARKFPSLEDQYPDLMEQVIVIWQTPAIIPNTILVFSKRMPGTMRESVSHAIPVILQTVEGKSAFISAFGVETLIPVNNALFEDFHDYLVATRSNLFNFLK